MLEDKTLSAKLHTLKEVYSNSLQFIKSIPFQYDYSE